jgi:hypothetical protein
MKKAYPYMIELQNRYFVQFEMPYSCVVIVLKIIFSAYDRRRTRYKLPGSDYVSQIFVFLRSVIICTLWKLTLEDLAKITLQLGVNLSDLV